MGVYLNWFKSYDRNAENAKTQKMKKKKKKHYTNNKFFTKLKKNGKGNICLFCHNF